MLLVNCCTFGTNKDNNNCVQLVRQMGSTPPATASEIAAVSTISISADQLG